MVTSLSSVLSCAFTEPAASRRTGQGEAGQVGAADRSLFCPLAAVIMLQPCSTSCTPKTTMFHTIDCANVNGAALKAPQQTFIVLYNIIQAKQHSMYDLILFALELLNYGKNHNHTHFFCRRADFPEHIVELNKQTNKRTNLVHRPPVKTEYSTIIA